jgi:hypothetical protein
MHIKIVNPKKDGNSVYTNAGSCTGLVKYLIKEDKERGIEQEFFFNHDSDQVSAAQVINTIDNLRSGVGKKEVKFYSLIISPKEQELATINNSTKELRNYTRKVMEEYAGNFNGLNKIKKIQAKDLAYFAKIEFNRYYKGTDEEVKQKKAKVNDKKPGNNMHVHLIVSRKDKTNKIKLSPQANNKKLFHIEGFKLKGCYLFDREHLTTDAAIELENKMIERTGNTKELDLYKQFKPEHCSPPTQKTDEQILRSNLKNQDQTGTEFQKPTKKPETKPEEKQEQKQEEKQKTRKRGHRF